MNKEFWKSTRGKSLIKLIGWFIFIILVYVLLMAFGSKEAPSEKDNLDNTTPEVEPEKLSLDIRNKDYDFKYVINTNEQMIVINGNIKDKVESGYKETGDGIIHYFKEEDKIYQDILGQKQEITDFYDNLEKEFLDYHTLYPILETNDCSNDICTFPYNDYEIIIDKTIDSKFKINITDENTSYELTFSNIK